MICSDKNLILNDWINMKYITTEEAKKLINPNSNRYSEIVHIMFYEADNGYDFIFSKLPKDMNESERIKLLKWFKVFGNKSYRYSLSDESIIGKKMVE